MPALKIVVSLWLIVVGLFTSGSLTFAQQETTSAITPTSKNWSAEAQTSFTVTNLMETGITTITGVCYEASCPKKTYDGKSTKVALYPNGSDQGALGALTGTMAMLYNPPTSSVYYLANLGDNLGIGPKTAYAQVTGSGQGIIAPILELWKVTRNIAYLFFILVFMVVGFMVMFRAKINPQTVISAQAALPSLVVGLILVTFSYFIAALIVDLAFVGIHLVTWLFIQSGLNNSLGTPQQLQEFAQTANIFNLFGSSAFNGNNMSEVWEGVRNQLYTSTAGPLPAGPFGFGSIIATITGAIAGFIALPPFGVLIGGALGAAAMPIIIPFIVILILVIALFIQMFRLLFELLSAYISILVNTLVGPLLILAGSIPGRGGSIGNWWKGLLANTLIFPAVFAVFLFAGIILGDSRGWSNTTVPLLGGLDQNFIRVLIAYGILLGSPAVPKAIKDAFGVKDLPIGQTAMQGFMSGVGTVTGASQRGYGAASGELKRQRETYQKEVSESRVTGDPSRIGGVAPGSWRERLFRRGLPW